MQKHKWKRFILYHSVITAIILFIFLVYQCPILYFFHIPCPGCGITRAHISALTGDFQTAFSYHPLFVTVVPTILYTAHRNILKKRFSDKAEKIYFPFEYKVSVWSYVQGSNPNAYTVKWYISDCEPYLIGGAGAIYGYRLYEAKHRSNIRNDQCRVANVTYLYNYVGCPNGGEYWVDSYDASPISFIPPEPEREEYRFCGWYKEPECINAWDFEKDVTGEELLISRDNQYTEYEGIYLYAKWER